MAIKTEDEWLERFGDTIPNYDGSDMHETFGKDLEAVKSADIKTVWTVLEGENETLYLAPGMHFVDRIGYVIAEKPITDEELSSKEWEEVVWMEGSELTDEPDFPM